MMQRLPDLLRSIAYALYAFASLIGIIWLLHVCVQQKWLTIPALNSIPDAVFEPAGIVAGVIAGAFGGLADWFGRRQQAATTSSQPLPTLDARNRQALINKVRRFWVTDYLKHSLIEEIQIVLNLADRLGATLTPTNLVARWPGQAADRPLPPGTPIISVYDEQAQALLILGAPGSGKTTLLLELAKMLLDRAEQEADHPIPVVFNLSSWGASRPSFDTWLVEQLNLVYDVPRKLGQLWVTQGQILPLLDGLDEVASDRRAACVEVINTHRQRASGLQPLVICCREAEYQALPPLRLHGAVVVQPLTQSQIEVYLAALGPSVRALRTAVLRYTPLREMLHIPLMLNIIALVYRNNQGPSPALAENEASWRELIFGAYVVQVLEPIRKLARGNETFEQDIDRSKIDPAFSTLRTVVIFFA